MAQARPSTPSTSLPLIPAGLAKELQPIANEIDRIHESVRDSAQAQFEQLKLWRAMNMILGVPAAVLAAIAGGTSLAAQGKEYVPGVLALCAAGFGAALTTLNPSRRVAQAQAAANAYLGMQTDCRQFLTIDLVELDRTEARERLSELTARRDEVNKTADPPSRFAWWRARKVIESDGQLYAVDQGSPK